MNKTVERTVKMRTHRVVITEAHGTQMFGETFIEAAVCLTYVLSSKQNTCDDVHQILCLSVKVGFD